MRHCLYCEDPLGDGIPAPVAFDDSARRRVVPAGRSPSATAPARVAYDPALGRLWEICPRCRRWNPVPLELRWEVLEGWEEAVQDGGKALVRTDHLALVRVGDAEVVRVDRPPRVEWGGWRYGDRLPAPERRVGWVRRLFGALPPPPLGGYDPYGLQGMGGVGGDSLPTPWLASPFFGSASALSLAFASVPFAPECPSCGGPMPIHPWSFQEVAFQISGGRVGVEAACALCGVIVLLPRRDARPALRLGLALVDRGPEPLALGTRAGSILEQAGGPDALLGTLGRGGATLGALDPAGRIALGMALDEEAEAEALEAEWREAEEIAAIMDGELTRVPGFEAFRARVLGEE